MDSKERDTRIATIRKELEDPIMLKAINRPDRLKFGVRAFEEGVEQEVTGIFKEGILCCFKYGDEEEGFYYYEELLNWSLGDIEAKIVQVLVYKSKRR